MEGGAGGDRSLFGQGLHNFAPETKMLMRGGSQASLPAYLLNTQTPQPHPGREDTGSAGSTIRHPALFPKVIAGKLGQPVFSLPVSSQHLDRETYLPPKTPQMNNGLSSPLSGIPPLWPSLVPQCTLKTDCRLSEAPFPRWVTGTWSSTLINCTF